MTFDGVAEVLGVPGTDLRLVGKAESRPGRRLGVALARADSVAAARDRATLAASVVTVRSS